MNEVQAPSYDHELQLALRLAREAGAAVLEYYDTPLLVEQKQDASDFEPVTQADRVANELIVSGIRKEFPEDGILAEESVDTDRRLDKRRVWLREALKNHQPFLVLASLSFVTSTASGGIPSIR